MSTSQEMARIRATFTPQGVQQALPLAAAGYVEASVLSSSYPFLPIPAIHGGAQDRERSNRAFLSHTTTRYGHCGQ